MGREADPSTSENDFLLLALRKGLRTDGRSPYEMRNLKLRFGNELGWVEATLGQSR
jgi:exosome complex component RRP45